MSELMSRCISPLLIRNSGRRDVVPCGKCNYCLETKRGDWSFRLMQEYAFANGAHFLTMTYDNANLIYSVADRLPELHKEHCQRFMKRLRKENLKYCNWPVRYYTVGEYGTETQRPHYHSIIFNLHEKSLNSISDIWSHGHVYVGSVSQASVHYVTKYVINRVNDYGTRSRPFALMSRNPGLGYSYIHTHGAWHRADLRNYTLVNGIKARVPRYLKDAIFTSIDRQKMALQSIAQSDEQYWKEIKRLSMLHHNPESYYEERNSYNHDVVTRNANKNSKF